MSIPLAIGITGLIFLYVARQAGHVILSPKWLRSDGWGPAILGFFILALWLVTIAAFLTALWKAV